MNHSLNPKQLLKWQLTCENGKVTAVSDSGPLMALAKLGVLCRVFLSGNFFCLLYQVPGKVCRDSTVNIMKHSLLFSNMMLEVE